MFESIQLYLELLVIQGYDLVTLNSTSTKVVFVSNIDKNVRIYLWYPQLCEGNEKDMETFEKRKKTNPTLLYQPSLCLHQ